MTNNITFHWLKSLKNKRIRVEGIEGIYNGGQYKCCDRGHIRVKVDDTWVVLPKRNKEQIEILD